MIRWLNLRIVRMGKTPIRVKGDWPPRRKIAMSYIRKKVYDSTRRLEVLNGIKALRECANWTNGYASTPKDTRARRRMREYAEGYGECVDTTNVHVSE